MLVQMPFLSGLCSGCDHESGLLMLNVGTTTEDGKIKPRAMNGMWLMLTKTVLSTSGM
jgi:hypothetical protein